MKKQAFYFALSFFFSHIALAESLLHQSTQYAANNTSPAQQPTYAADPACLAKWSKWVCDNAAKKKSAEDQLSTKEKSIQAPQTNSISPAKAKEIAAENVTLLKQGMWKDPTTGLTWVICEVSDAWKAGACVDTSEQAEPKPAESNSTNQIASLPKQSRGWWNAALAIKAMQFGGHDDWRLPTIQELAALNSTCPPPGGDSPNGPYSVFPRYSKIETTSGTVSALSVCPSNERVTGPKLPSQFSVNGGQSLWSSTLEASDTGLVGQETQVFALNGAYNSRSNRPVNAIAPNYSEYIGAIAVRGGSYDEFNQLLALAPAAVAKEKNEIAEKEKFRKDLVKAAAEADRRNKEAFDAQQKGIKAYDIRTAKLRANAKAGDTVGIVINGQGKRALVLKVTTDLVLVQLDDSGEQRWVKRNDLYP